MVRLLALVVIAGVPGLASAQPTDRVGSTTLELGAGITWGNIDSNGGYANHYSLMDGPGLGIGFGRFLTQDVALSVRASGALLVANAKGWLGVIGPNVQGWFGDAFVGGGIGIGLGVGCYEGCGASTTWGVDVRAGYRVSGSVTLSVELESLDPISSASVKQGSLLVGFQSF